MAIQRFDEDELEVIQTPKKTRPAATEEDAAPAKNTRAAVADEGEEEEVATTPKASANTGTEDDIEWGDEKTMYRGDGLDRLRPEKGKTVRFAIVPFLKPKRTQTHYFEKKGTYRCLSTEETQAICCVKANDDSRATTTVVALVLQYTNAPDKDGKYKKDANGKLPPIEWKIAYVQLGKTNFRDISELAPEGSKATDIDICMSHKENGIGYKFTLASPTARWTLNPELVEEVKDACKKFLDGKKLEGKLGKRVSSVEMKALLASLGPAAAEDQNLDDLDGV